LVDLYHPIAGVNLLPAWFTFLDLLGLLYRPFSTRKALCMREVEKERKSQIKNILRRMYLGGSDRQKRLYIIFYTSDINLGARLGGGAANQNPARDP
jgi:hypothetical protein